MRSGYGPLLFGLVVSISVLACGDGNPPAAVEDAKEALVETAHNAECEAIFGSIEENDGYDVPGASNQPRFGMPDGLVDKVRVRKSYASLTPAEKKLLTEAFLKLKQTPYEYTSLCESLGQPQYSKNMYDYFVEAHASAFVSMNTPYMTHYQMPHMGPHFTAWHRYYLLRIEAQIRTVLGDPEFTLPYWDWNDCGERDADDPDANPCPEVFEVDYLGSGGTCDDETVTGVLVDGGFASSIYTTPGAEVFATGSITCSNLALQRQLGCSNVAPLPAQGAEVTAIFDRTVYDASPYDSCNTDQDVSFRQYLEGFTMTDVNPLCITGGCQMHGKGHYYIGGTMASGGGTPNDPMFFLHHANIDRLWAEWQANNLASGREVDFGNPDFPEDWRGPIFIWNDVDAEELFDHRALGFTYDTLEERL